MNDLEKAWLTHPEICLRCSEEGWSDGWAPACEHLSNRSSSWHPDTVAQDPVKVLNRVVPEWRRCRLIARCLATSRRQAFI